MITNDTQQWAAVSRVEQHATDTTGRTFIADERIDAEHRNALIAHGNGSTLSTAAFFAQDQLAAIAGTEAVQQVLSLRLAHLITRAQSVGFQQGVAVRQQRLTFVVGQVQTLETIEVGTLFGTLKCRCIIGTSGCRSAGEKSPAQQHGHQFPCQYRLHDAPLPNAIVK